MKITSVPGTTPITQCFCLKVVDTQATWKALRFMGEEKFLLCVVGSQKAQILASFLSLLLWRLLQLQLCQEMDNQLKSSYLNSVTNHSNSFAPLTFFPFLIKSYLELIPKLTLSASPWSAYCTDLFLRYPECYHLTFPSCLLH